MNSTVHYSGSSESHRLCQLTVHRRTASSRSKRRPDSMQHRTLPPRAGRCILPIDPGTSHYITMNKGSSHHIISHMPYIHNTFTSGGSWSLELSSDPSQGADEQDAIRHRLTRLSLPPLTKRMDSQVIKLRQLVVPPNNTYHGVWLLFLLVRDRQWLPDY